MGAIHNHRYCVLRALKGAMTLTMNNKLTITVEPEGVELTRRMKLYERNQEWMSEHGVPLYDYYPGKYVVVSEGEVFFADDRQEAKRPARKTHPDDKPFVIYLPKEKYERTYAG